MTHQDDHIFITKTLEGEVNAFAVLVDRYKHMVYTLSFRMMKTTEDAEEIAQDVFLKAFQKLNTYKGNSKFSTWLYSITYHRCLDMLSRKRKQITHYASEIQEEITEEKTASILEAIEADELKGQLEHCIQQLREEEAFLVTLYYLEEQTLEEIAELTGMTKNNVKVKIFRSRKKLYTIMASQLPKDIVARYERN
ncbi:RNA polymerase sigma factor [Dokdonia ponticola]|uniref:RNA polymerase sigma factor n=1 Tax=Dokdonia ponticola TaxID=2041041 RepID=A0ABV9HSE2_9FLAO